MKLLAIHTVNGGDVLIETDAGVIAVKRHTDHYSSARRVAVVPDDMRHTVKVGEIPKRKRGEDYAGGIAF